MSISPEEDPIAPAPTEDVIEIERWIEARPETVFSYFTDPERFLRWQGGDASIEILEVVAPRRLVFTWGLEGITSVDQGLATLLAGASIVEISLESQGGGTLLRLRQRPSEAGSVVRNHQSPLKA